MARRPRPPAFGSAAGKDGSDRAAQAARRGQNTSSPPRQQVIPDAVAARMVRRIAVATGTPTLLGMGVIVASYLLVSRGVLDIAPGLTLAGSGAFFVLGLLGLSYGVLSASWEDGPGSLLGFEQIGVNIGRVRDSVKAMRQGSRSAAGSGSGRPQG
ncbi:MAG: hypothetical protein ER33_01250 [Cyanobium sp. CACIAM 14]|nr:MAG: hypothetical protein ER33_01250 [Cyanobium sp. CACIAM 14]